MGASGGPRIRKGGSPVGPAPLWIDTDGGIDDLLAIAYLVGRGARLSGVSTVAGNVPLEMATRNACGLLRRLGVSLPVLSGAAQPLRRELVVATDVHGAGGIGRFAFDPGEVPAAAGPATSAALLARLGEPTDLLMLGPLTNLAGWVGDPRLLGLLRRVTVMGGAVDVPGNITPEAEYNFYVDPEAVETVLAAGLELCIVPRDAVLGVRAPLVLAPPLPSGRVGALLAEVLASFGGRPLYDPVAAHAALLGRAVPSSRERLAIDGARRGRVVRVASGPDLDLCRPFEAAGFLPVFAQALRVAAART